MNINTFINTIYLPFLSAFIVTVLSVPLSLKLIKKLKLFDDPKTHNHPAIIHLKPVPRGGGIPLFIGIFICGLLFLPFTKITIGLYIASFIALITGVLDDKYDISPYLRFIINIICALIIVISGINIPFITNPFGGILHLNTFKITFEFLGNFSFSLSDIIALVWIVWIMNMLNWSKGVDGQMPGVVAISAIVIGILSLRFTMLDINSLTASKLSFIIAGGMVAFLIFNFYPAKIFPGYGATSVYLLLAAMSILPSVKLATAILVMGIPFIDGAFTILRRLFSKKSPFKHDNKHLHHIFLRLGFNQRTIALFYWFFSAILGAISLTLTSPGKAFAIIILVTLAGGFLITLHLIFANPTKNE